MHATNAAARHQLQLNDLLAFVHASTGRDFAAYKRSTVLHRIARRMQAHGLRDLGAYLHCLRTQPEECTALLHGLLVSVTNFFRDVHAFAALAARIPALFAGKGPGDVVRVWVAACASGEEAYTVAMLLDEHARTLALPPLIQVFATDLDQAAMQLGRAGFYPISSMDDVSAQRLGRYFDREPQGWRVNSLLRAMVLFASHDMLQASPLLRLDLATCRNLLIYLTHDGQRQVLRTLHGALLPDGLLMLGGSESVDGGNPHFLLLDPSSGLYRQQHVPPG